MPLSRFKIARQVAMRASLPRQLARKGLNLKEYRKLFLAESLVSIFSFCDGVRVALSTSVFWK
jgi:hypothetical protein